MSKTNSFSIEVETRTFVLRNPKVLTVGGCQIPSFNIIWINVIPVTIINALIKTKQNFFELDEKTQNKFKIIMSVPNIKATISHELTHWLDESLKNNQITQYIEKLKNKYKKNYKNIDLQALCSHIEIQAYIHGVKEFKRNVGDELWNSMSFKELFDHSILSSVFSDVKKLSSDERKIWLKRFFGRMSREGLIGKNMSTKNIDFP